MIHLHSLFTALIQLVPQVLRSSLGLILLMSIGCSAITSSHWDQRYGKTKPREVSDIPLRATLTYYKDTKPILEQRCGVCHGCYDAPCQLKLEAYEGLLRGANPNKVYDGTRLLGASLTRLFEDANTTAEWRSKGFHPVLNERRNTTNANINAGVMAQMLELKKAHPLPTSAILPDSFDFNLDHKQHCSSIEGFASFAESKPLWGMPYGLPGLSSSEHKITIDWLAQGAAMGTATAIPAGVQKQIED